MFVHNITERTRLLQAEFRHLWQQAQILGSGATIHALISRLSTARGALCLVEERQAWDTQDHLALLLDLAETSLHEARTLIAQTSRSRTTKERAARRTVRCARSCEL